MLSAWLTTGSNILATAEWLPDETWVRPTVRSSDKQDKGLPPS
jgi:hypothetical protein